MSKRIQYAQSLPALPSDPVPEAGRVVLFARPTGVYVRLEDGSVAGPLTGPAPAVVGGTIPSSRVALPTPSALQMGQLGQGGTFEDVPGLSVSVTSGSNVPLFALANLALSTVSGNSSTEVSVRIAVDAGPEQVSNGTRVIIPRSAELNAGSPSLLTTPLPAGAYTARVQWRRVSGTGVPEITTGNLFVQAQQAPQGVKGDPGEPGTDGTNGIDGVNGLPGPPGADGGVTLDTEQYVTGTKHFATGTLLMTSPYATDAEPYSDANPPETLMMEEIDFVPPAPGGTLSVMYADTTGRLFFKHHDGTTYELTNQASQTTTVKEARTVLVDFGAIPTYSRSFVINDVNLTTASVVDVVQSGKAAPGRSADENEMDPLLARAVPGAGQMTVYVNALDGPVVGTYGLQYQVG